MLKAQSIRMQYQTPGGALLVLRDVNLTVSAGVSASIMGPSGSGKSTLLNILGALEPPTSGSLNISDCDPYALGSREMSQFRNRHIGFVFQEHHLLPQCTVLDNVLLPTLPGGRIDQDTLERAGRLLERVGLSARATHRPAELSGGERQRVALARALINEPLVVLADEPTGSLDRATAEQVAEVLWELHRQANRVLIIATHSEVLAEQADQHLELRDGVLVSRDAARP